MKMKQDRTWLFLLCARDEAKLPLDGFPAGEEMGRLPDRLNQAITHAAPNGSIDFKRAYLLTDQQKKKVISYAESNSLPYHEYAVVIRGEKCIVKGCELHHACMVINLHDRRQKAKGVD